MASWLFFCPWACTVYFPYSSFSKRLKVFHVTQGKNLRSNCEGNDLWASSTLSNPISYHYWPLCFLLNTLGTLLPLGLCTYYFLHLKCSLLRLSHHQSLHFLQVSTQIPSSRCSQTVLNTPSSFSCFIFCNHQTNYVFCLLFAYCLSLLLEEDNLLLDGVFFDSGGALFAWLFGFFPSFIEM